MLNLFYHSRQVVYNNEPYKSYLIPSNLVTATLFQIRMFSFLVIYYN